MICRVFCSILFMVVLLFITNVPLGVEICEQCDYCLKLKGNERIIGNHYHHDFEIVRRKF